MAKRNFGFQMEEINNAERGESRPKPPAGIAQKNGGKRGTAVQPKLKQITVFPSQFDANVYLTKQRILKPKETNAESRSNENQESITNYESTTVDSTYTNNRGDIQSNNGDSQRGKMNIRKALITFFVILLYALYFGAVLILHSDKESEDYWCDGDGLLIIVTLLVTFLLLYSKVFKPLIGRKIYKKILRPIMKKTKTCRSVWWMSYLLYIIIILLTVGYLVYDARNDTSRLISLLGIFSILLFGYAFSAARKKVIWSPVIWGLGLQFIFAFIILKWSIGKSIFECLGGKINTFLNFTDEGSGMVFGELSTKMGIFAFRVLSIVLFFSFSIRVLYYYGAMQWLVKKIGWLLQITMGTTACESMNAAGNIFLGQTEAPLLIKPFVPKMTKSELHAVMTGGFATIAGSVMAAYISFGVNPVQLLSASVMSAPAALAYSKLFYPETEVSLTKAKDIKIEKGKEANVLHAAIEGVSSAIPLVANIAANLIAVVSFMAFVDAILNWSCVLLTINDGVCSLSNLLGYALMPLAWLLGVPWDDCYIVGQLIGTKTMINEFVAYIQLSEHIRKQQLTQRGEFIATFALCGFANFSSIGIMLGGLGPMAPHRKGDMSKVVLRAMIAGNLACFLTACVAGALVSTDSYSMITLNTTSDLNITELAKNSTASLNITESLWKY